MERFILTAEHLQKARSYLPLAEKEAFVEACTEKCFDNVKIMLGNESMPDMLRENYALKSRYLMTALVRDYLGIPCTTVKESDGKSDLMEESDYDRFASSNLYRQIIAWKQSAAMKRFCSDLLADYNFLERWFNAALKAQLSERNDFVSRQYILSKDAAKELPKLLEELEKLGKLQGENGGAKENA